MVPQAKEGAGEPQMVQVAEKRPQELWWELVTRQHKSCNSLVVWISLAYFCTLWVGNQAGSGW